jgi:hypothetical protein
MTPDEFVGFLRDRAMNAAVDGTAALLENPPGRKPSHELKEASQWYHKLTEHDRRMLMRVVCMASHQAVFGVLAILDGVRKVDDSDDGGTFKLSFRKGEQEWDLTGSDTPFLHDLLNETGTNEAADK